MSSTYVFEYVYIYRFFSTTPFISSALKIPFLFVVVIWKKLCHCCVVFIDWNVKQRRKKKKTKLRHSSSSSSLCRFLSYGLLLSLIKSITHVHTCSEGNQTSKWENDDGIHLHYLLVDFLIIIIAAFWKYSVYIYIFFFPLIPNLFFSFNYHFLFLSFISYK